MYANTSPFASRSAPRHIADAYQQVGVQTGVEAASPHRLTAMLYDGLLEAIAQAHGAMQVGDVALKGRALGRAVRIVDEGLKAALNIAEGGQLAVDLSDLYGWLTLRLTEANLRSDPSALDECKRVIEPLREAWQAIAAEVEGAHA